MERFVGDRKNLLEPDGAMSEKKCPRCGQVLEAVGKFWICPEHGQAALEKPPDALRIFLSYGHDSNEELVRCIKTDLEQRGHAVWFDKSEIKSGSDWRRSITEGIVKSQRVLSFLSRHSTRIPGVCLDEIAIAVGVKGGNIQTVLVESEQEVKPPPSISHIQWLDMHDWKEHHEAGGVEWEQWYKSKLAEIVAVVESEESRRFAGEIRTLEDLLKPISSEARICQLLQKELVGREWLVEALELWRRSSGRESRLFWITGAPGTGKSAFAAHLAHYGKDRVLGVHFCEFDKPDHRSAHRIVRTLAFQVATRLPDYRKLLLTLPEITLLESKNPAELFDYLLAYPLTYAIRGDREKFLLVIDALDEVGANDRNELVELLAQNAARLPDWIGLVVTSRPEKEISGPLQALKPFPIEAASEANWEDIRSYLRRELSGLLGKGPEADRLVEQILEKSEGVFLYAERVCHDLQQGNITLDQLDQFPQGLGGVFWQFFQRRSGNLEEFRRETRPALRAILAAQEPLPIETIQHLFNWQTEEVWDFTRSLGSLFPEVAAAGGVAIQPFHKSLADWLTDEGRAGVYFVSPTEGHRALALLGGRQLQEGAAGMDSYLLLHLPAHLAALQNWEELVALLCREDFVLAAEKRFPTRQYSRVDAYRKALENAPPQLCDRLWAAPLPCTLLALKAVGSLVDRGEHDRARRLLLAGQKTITKREQPELSCNWNNLAGRLAVYSGDRAEAEARLAEALQAARNAGYQEGAAKALLGMAVLMRKFGGSPSSAKAALEEALSLDFSAFDLDFQVRARLNLAMVHICRGDAGRAQESLSRASDLVEKAGNPILRPWLWKYTGFLKLLQRAPDQAARAFQEASELFARNGHFQEAQRCGELRFCALGPQMVASAQQRLSQLCQKAGGKIPPELQKNLERIQQALLEVSPVPGEAAVEKGMRVAQELLAAIRVLDRLLDPNPLASMLKFK